MAASDDDAPLPLSELRDRVSADTYTWLQDADAQEVVWNAQLEHNEEYIHATNLFEQPHNNNDDDDDDDFYRRVQEWSSSSHKPDGIGGVNNGSSSNNNVEEVEADAVTVQYILSEAGGGHGDDLWAASRHVANLLANKEKCLDLLAPLFSLQCCEEEQGVLLAKKQQHNYLHHDGPDHDHDHHPLLGVRFVELGAGAGVPSWTAMRCGARVVCTDQAIANRIRCIAECAERNWREMKAALIVPAGDDVALVHGKEVRACPYDWGTPIEQVVTTKTTTTTTTTTTQEAAAAAAAVLLLDDDDDDDKKKKNGDRRLLFDVVVAADCIYMPELHSLLLDSIKMLMAEQGVALLPFALHGNTKDDSVWGIVELAKGKGFQVEIMESQQLTPQACNMESKRALINMLRLTHQTTLL